jgi:hypothetical protein
MIAQNDNMKQDNMKGLQKYEHAKMITQKLEHIKHNNNSING